MEKEIPQEMLVANRNLKSSNINERLQQLDENQNHLLPIQEDNLLELKKELGLIDGDGNDFYTQFSPSMAAEDSVFAVSTASDADSGFTPFDSPLTDEERILLEQCTIGSPVSFSARADRTSIRSSQSLDQITDILIRDLEGFNLSTLETCEEQSMDVRAQLNQKDSIEYKREISKYGADDKRMSCEGNLQERSCISSREGTSNKFRQTEKDRKSVV